VVAVDGLDPLLGAGPAASSCAPLAGCVLAVELYHAESYFIPTVLVLLEVILVDYFIDEPLRSTACQFPHELNFFVCSHH
jgi:H+/Cl- antiporter ClcA